MSPFIFSLKTSFIFEVLLNFLTINSVKGPVKLIQRAKIAHSFLQSVPNQSHFKLAYAVQDMAVKEFFETHF